MCIRDSHTTGAAQTIDRIVDACPAEAKNQVDVYKRQVHDHDADIPQSCGDGPAAAAEGTAGSGELLSRRKRSAGSLL